MIMADKKNLSALAKGKKTIQTQNNKPKVIVPKKEVVVKEEVKSPIDVTRNIVSEIVKNVTNKIEGSDKSNVIVEEPIVNGNDVNNMEWLQEQVDLLTQENIALNQELNEMYNSTNNNEVDNRTINEIISLFNELQNNLTGNNSQGQKWTMASIPHLLMNLVNRFPFLDKYRRV